MIEITSLLPTFMSGDEPSPSTLAVLIEDDEWVDSVTALVLSSHAEEIEGVTAVYADEAVTVTWPADPFTEAGLHYLSLTFVGEDQTETVSALPFVVEQAASQWVSLTQARVMWADAPDDDVALFHVLDAAHTAVIEYAPAIEEGSPIPPSYRQAQLMQARSIWTAQRGDKDGSQFGAEGIVIPVFPLDWHVRQLLRPKTGVPVMG